MDLFLRIVAPENLFANCRTECLFLLQILVPETFCKLLIDEKVQLLQIIVPQLFANLFSRSLILHIVVPDHFILHLFAISV